VALSRPSPPLEAEDEDIDVPCAIEGWILGTDAGSDVKASRELVLSETATWVNKLVFDFDCAGHQYHIMCFCLLFGLDSVLAPVLGLEHKVYTTLAMILHLWRDNVREAFDAVSKALTGQTELLRPFMKVPPRPLAGRWGRTSDCIRYVLTALGYCVDDTYWVKIRDALVRAFSARSYFSNLDLEEKAELALAERLTTWAAEEAGHVRESVAATTAPIAKARAKAKAKSIAAKAKAAKAKLKARTSKRKATTLDETAEDENKAWEGKMGKWAKGAIAGLHCDKFWIALLVADVVLSRLDVFYYTVMKKRPHIGNLAYLLFGGGDVCLWLIESLLDMESLDSLDDSDGSNFADSGEDPWKHVFRFVKRRVPDLLDKVSLLAAVSR
jgi:hypothetical protein